MSHQISKIKSALHGNLGVMVVSSGIWVLSENLTSPFYALYVLALGGDYAMVGKILGIKALVQIVPMIIGGYLTDKAGRKQIIYTMSYLLACTALIKAFAPDYRFLLIAAVLEALFQGLRQPSLNSIVSDSTTPDNRSLSLALWTLGQNLAGIFSPSILGLIMDRYGEATAMRWGYIALFFIGGLSSFIRQRYLKETLEKTTKSSEPNQLLELINNFKLTLSSLNKQAANFVALDMVFTLALGLAEPYFVTYATDALHVSGGQWGFIMSLVTLIHCTTLYLVASPSDRGRTRFVKASMISWPVSYFLFLSSGNYPQIMVTRILVTISAALGQPAWNALFADYCPREHRGRFNALLEVAWSLLYGGGNYIGGLLYQGMGVKAPFQVAMALMAVGGLASILFLKEPTHKEQ